VIVVVVTVIVVGSVVGLFVWGGVQEGREEKSMKASRAPKGLRQPS
jgi:hypothetical protein